MRSHAQKIHRILDELCIDIATPEDARKRVGAKGKKKQAF
jgi:hypothetical protein